MFDGHPQGMAMESVFQIAQPNRAPSGDSRAERVIAARITTSLS